MIHFATFARGIVAVLVLLAFFATSSSAAHFPERKKPKPKANAAQKKAALEKSEKQAAADVAKKQFALQGIMLQGQLAEGKYGMAHGKLNEAVQLITSMKAEIEEAENTLRAVEAGLEEQQPADSEYAKAKVYAESSQKAYLAAREKILSTPAYKAALEKAKQSDDPAAAIAEAQDDALHEDPNFSKVRGARDAAQQQYQIMRQQLFTTDETWKTASSELRAIRKQVTDAETSIAGAGIHKTSAAIDLKQAQQAAAAVAASLQQSQAKLKSIQASLKKAKKSSSGSSSAKGKK